MIVPMNHQKIVRRPERALALRNSYSHPWSNLAFDRLKASLKAFELAIEEFLQKSPLLNFPFYAAIPFFVIILGVMGPSLGWNRSEVLQYKALEFPEDQQIAELLMNVDNLEATLEHSVEIPEVPQTSLVPFKVLEIQMYQVQPGDSLSTIANRHGISLSTLINYNNIQNVRRLQVGMELKVPNQDGLIYSVKKGDSLSSIAKNSGVEYDQILDLNNLETPVIHPGQALFLPGATLSSFELKQALGELFIFPARGILTSSYGLRNDPFTGVKRFHNGIDIANVPGTAVRASMDGRVGDVGFHSSYGNYIIVNHDGGFQTMYAHLRSFSVKRGQVVSQGSKIGEMGSTGYSTGSHLHFSLFKRNQHMDPLKVLH